MVLPEIPTTCPPDVLVEFLPPITCSRCTGGQHSYLFYLVGFVCVCHTTFTIVKVIVIKTKSILSKSKGVSSVEDATASSVGIRPRYSEDEAKVSFSSK